MARLKTGQHLLVAGSASCEMCRRPSYGRLVVHRDGRLVCLGCYRSTHEAGTDYDGTQGPKEPRE